MLIFQGKVVPLQRFLTLGKTLAITQLRKIKQTNTKKHTDKTNIIIIHYDSITRH